MALQNITPQYQAEEKTAQLHLRPVPIHNGLYETGKMLTDAGQGLQKGAFSLTLGLKQRNDKLQSEKDDLALTDALNRATTEGTKYAAELNKLTGREAEGNTQKLDTFMDKLLADGQVGLTPRAARIYGQRFASLRLSLWNSVNGHEFNNTRNASVAEKKNLVQNGLATFQLTEDPNDLLSVLGYQADLYEAQYGARLPDALVEDWGPRHNEADGQKNAGWDGIHMDSQGRVVTEKSAGYKIGGKEVDVPLLNPYTKNYVNDILNDNITPEIDELTRKWGEDRIAQGKSPFYNGDPEDDPLRTLNDSQKAVEGRLKIFMMERQNVIDAAVGVLAEKYSKNNDLDSLNNLYNAIDQKGLPVGDTFLPVSASAKLQIKQVLDQQFDYQETFYGARTIFDGIKAADPRTMGGQYWTEKQDQVFWNWNNILESSVDPKDHKKAQYIRSWYDDLKKTQQRNLGIAVEENAAGLFLNPTDMVSLGHDLMMLENIMSSMPDNPVKDQLRILHDKYQDAYNQGDAKLAKAFADAQKLEATQRAAAEKAIEDEKKRRDAQQAAIDKAWQNSDERKRAVARFKLGFYTNSGVVSFKDGPSFDLKSKAGQERFIAFARYDGKSGWLFEEDIKYFEEMFSGQISSDARRNAASLIADVLNLSRKDNAWNYINVNDMMPDLVDEVMRDLHVGDNPTDANPLGAQRDKDIVKQYVSERLLEKATLKTRPSSLWNFANILTPNIPLGTAYWLFGPSTEVTLGDFMQDGINKYGNLNLDREQQDFNKLTRSDAQRIQNDRMMTKLGYGDNARVGSKADTAIWMKEQEAAQNKAVEGAEE